MINSTESVPLRGRQALANPNCIGRKAECKLCEVKKIVPERIWG